MARTKKEQIELVITGIGVVVLAVIIAVRFGKPKEKAPETAVPSETVVEGAAPEKAKGSPPASSRGLLMAQEKVLTGPMARDPFSPVSEDGSTLAAGVSSMRLKGISIKTDSEPIAMIGNSIVRKGDTVQGVRVLEIGRDYVLIRKGSREYKLGLER